MADCYRSPKLFKKADKIIIPSLQSRVNPDFKTTLLKNRENKAQMIELIFEYIQTEALLCLELLGLQEIILSSEDDCLKDTAIR